MQSKDVLIYENRACPTCVYETRASQDGDYAISIVKRDDGDARNVIYAKIRGSNLDKQLKFVPLFDSWTGSFAYVYGAGTKLYF